MINTHSGRAKFKNFQILMDRGSSSMIVMGKLRSKLKTKEAEKNTWETQSGEFTTSKKVIVDFGILEFSAIKIVTCKFHVYKSTNGRYDMVLGRDLLITLVVDLKFSNNVIIGGEGPY